MRRLPLLLWIFLPLAAQDRLSRELQGTHVLATVPLIGKGTSDDPIRPMFVPSPAEIRAMAPRKDGIPPFPILVQQQLSDNKKSVLVEFMSHDRAVLQPILTSKAIGVKTFEKGKDKKEDVEAEFTKARAGFTLHSMSPARALDVTAVRAKGAAQ